MDNAAVIIAPINKGTALNSTANNSTVNNSTVNNSTVTNSVTIQPTVTNSTTIVSTDVTMRPVRAAALKCRRALGAGGGGEGSEVRCACGRVAKSLAGLSSHRRS